MSRSSQILIFKTTNAITTRLEHPSHSSFRRHIGTLSINDWESGLREATYQALLRENNREPTLRDQIYYAPLEGRQDSAIPFGDIVVLARGQLYSTYNGFKFVQDPYQNDCDDCHNGRIKCSPSQCRGWNPVTGEQLVALWTVKRIRHRDPIYGHRYELEYTLSPISAVVNSRFLLADGGFDYNIPGHVFIVKTDPNVDKSGFYYTTPGTTWFSNNYVNLDGKKVQTTKSSEDEIEIYKELIKSLAMKTSTSLKPLGSSPIYSDIFDATIQKVPVTMIHQQTIPAQKAPSTTTTVWTTPLVDETKSTKYSEPDPLYHPTTGRKTSKPPITTITFFAPDESITENDIFGSPHTTTTTAAKETTTGTVHADIFDVVTEISTNIQTLSTSKFGSNTVPEETTVVTTTIRPSTSKRTTTTPKPTRPYSKKTTSPTPASSTTKQPTRRTRKPFIPNRFTRPKPTRRRTTTTSVEFDEIFLQKTTTTTKSSTTEELMLTTKSTTPSIFDVPIEEVEKTTTAIENSSSTRTDVATEGSSVAKITSSGVDGSTEGDSSEMKLTTNEEKPEVVTTKTTVESSLTTPYKRKYTTPVFTTTENANKTIEYEEKQTKLPAVTTKLPLTTKEITEKTETMQFSVKNTKPLSTSRIPPTTTENVYAITEQYTRPVVTNEETTEKTEVVQYSKENTKSQPTTTIKNEYEKTETDETSKTYTKTTITTKTPSSTEEKTETEELNTKPTSKSMYEKSATVTISEEYRKTTTTKTPSTTKEKIEKEKLGKKDTKPTTKRMPEKSETSTTGEKYTKTTATTKTLSSENKRKTLPTTIKIPTETTTPIVFVGTIVTKRPQKPTKQEDIYDIFGEQTPSSVIEKPTTEKQLKTTAKPDDFLFGSEIKQLPTTTQEPVVIFDNFFEASTSSSNETNNNNTQLENNTEGEPLTSMSYITSISFQVNGKNITKQTDTMLKANVKEITTNASDFKVFKAEMPDTNMTKQQFDDLALSLINHARSIDILNKTKAVKQKKRRSYTPRRGRRRKVRREKMA